MEHVPITFGFQFIDDVISGSGDDEGGLEFDFALLLFEVAEHLGDDFEVAFVNHAGADEAEVDFFLAFVVGKGADDVVGVSLGDILVVNVGVGDHGLVDDVEIDHHFGVVFGVGIGSQRRDFAGADFGDALVCDVDEALEDAFFVVHAFVDHDLNASLGDLKRFDKGVGLGDADGGFGLHFSGPVGEGEGLVGEEGAEVDFDDSALEDVVSAEFVEHLGLGGVDDVAEVHVIFEGALEGDFDRLGDGHGGFAGGEGKGDGAGVGSEGHAFGHAGVGVAADDDGAVVHGEVVEDLVDDVGHGVVFVLGVASGDEAEVVHELHELRGVFLGFFVPDGSGVTAGLVGAIDDGGNGGGGHGFELLHGHEAGGVLGTDDIDFDAEVGAGIEGFSGSDADGVAVEDFFNGGESLSIVGNFLGGGVNDGGLNAEGLGGEGLEFFAENDGVGTTGFHELHFLRSEGFGDVDEFGLIVTEALIEFFSPGVDGEDGAGFDRVDLLEDGVAGFVEDGVAIGVLLFSPVLEIQADAAGDVDGGEEDGGDAIGARDNGGHVDEGDVGAAGLAAPEGDVVDTGHAGGADAHGAFFGNEHDALVGVEVLEGLDLLLSLRGDEALAVEFAIGAGVGLVAWGEEVGGDVALASDEGDDLGFFGDFRKFGEELGLGVAFEEIFGDEVAGLEGDLEALHVGVVEENLGLQDSGGAGCNCGVVAEGEGEEDVHGGAALHVGEELEGEVGGDFGDGDLAEDDFLEEIGLFTGGGSGAGEGVIDQEVEGIGAVLMSGVLDLGDDFGEEVGAIDGLGVEALFFAGGNLGEVILIEAHFLGGQVDEARLRGFGAGFEPQRREGGKFFGK